MKKRLIGTLLMGALFVSSTSVFVSCKDYDDDINNIVATKADKTALEEAKQTLQNEINGLKTQLETVNGQITALDKQKADKFTEDGKEYNLKDVWTNLNAKASALEASIALSNKAIDEINALLGGKLEGDLADKTYKQALQETWATAAAASAQAAKNLQAITALKNALEDPETGLQAVWKDLEGQKDALDKLAARVKAVEDDYLKAADKEYLLTQISNLETKLTTAIETAKNAAIAAAAEDATDKANKAKEAAIAATATDATNKANDAKQQAIEAAAEDAKKKANAAQAAAIYAASVYTDEQIAALNIDSLKTAVKGLSDRVDVIQPLVNNLNVYVRQALRGLVFDMKSFYQGIEATDITVLWYKKYELGKTNADSIEAYGYLAHQGADWTDYEPIADMDDPEEELAERLEEHEYVTPGTDKTTRYKYTTASRVLEFKAEYFMNPSSAAVATAEEDATAVKVIGFDKPFHSGLDTSDEDGWVWKDAEFNGETTEYEAGIAVKDWTVKDGKLIVNYDCTKPEAIRSIQNDYAVTVFATQVQVSGDGKDTLVTSDFAALYKQDVRDIVIAHTTSKAKAMLHNGQYIGSHAADLVNTHCGFCDYLDGDPQEDEERLAGLHLMQTVSEAAGTYGDKFKTSDKGGFAPQDSVGYKDSLNLEKLVEVHYTVYDANGNTKHKLMTAKEMAEKFGLHFEFELTGLYYGDNETSESAHAAIKHDGDSIWWFRPQMPTYEGKAAAWDNNVVKDGKVGKQDRQTIGRTPVVRVKLIDEAGNIVDYGYIRIKVVEWPTEQPIEFESVSYDTDGMVASKKFCTDLAGAPFTFTQKWNEMEWDIHHTFDLSQEEFENEYVIDGAANVFNQYYYNKTTQKLERVTEPVENVTANNKNVNKSIELGVIVKKEEPENFKTSVIVWTVTGDELAEYAELNAKADPIVAGDVQRWICFIKKENSTLAKGPHRIWVSLTPESFTITTDAAVTGTVDWTGRKLANYWYAKNSNASESGFVEVHANVFDVEAMTDICDKFDKVVPANFEGNKIVKNPGETGYDADMAAFIKLNDGASIAAKDLKLRLEFVGVDSIFKGIINGKEYQIITRPAFKKNDVTALDDANYVGKRALLAYVDKNADKKWDPTTEPIDTVATLEWTDASKKDINHMKVQYFDGEKVDQQYTVGPASFTLNAGEIAKALVNWRAHNALDDSFLTAFVAVGAKYETCDVPLSNNIFNVRFLRPVNVASNNKEVQDAAETVQTINLLDMLKFTDWRNIAFGTKFWYYYQIKNVEIIGVDDEEFLSDNEDVMTNLGADDANANLTKSLKSVSELVRFQYFAPETAYVAVQGEAPEAGAFGYIKYENLGSTVRDFKVRVPLKVTYYWGEVYTTADILVLKTLNNARAAK